jgi:nitronate monooxygenase
VQTCFTELVGCREPVQLAAMGGAVGGPALASAVRDAGGLGMVSHGESAPEGCGVNLLMPFVASAAMVAEAATGVRVLELFYAQPDGALVNAAHEVGAVVGWQVGSGEEAAAAEGVGCDYVVAQGTEAGGHVRGQDPLEVVLAAVRDRVGVPVVAAGGISTPERVRDLMTNGGADAVRVGTAFLVCTESRAHEDYVAALLAATGDDTVITEWFDEAWPNAPHRVLRAALDAAGRSGWRSPMPPVLGESRPAADMALYAGMGVGDVTRRAPAAAVLRHLVSLLPAD